MDSKKLQASWEKQGTFEEFKWHTVNDDEVCPLCKSRAEKTFPIKDLSKMYPAHEGCRCWVVPIVSLELFDKQLDKALGLPSKNKAD